MDTATIKRYAKFVVALAGAIGVAATEVVNGDVDTPAGKIAILIAVVAAFGVRQQRNAP